MSTYLEEKVNASLETARGLRALADLIEKRPELDWATYEGAFTASLFVSGDNEAATREAMVDVRRKLGGNFDKATTDYYFTLKKSLSENGSVQITINGDRGQVCERVVTGTKLVTEKLIPDDKLAEAEKLREQLKQLEVETEVEKPQYEWKCPETLTGIRVAGGAQ